MANEKRLIDANALLELVQFRIPIDNQTAEVIAGCVNITRRLIENAPTVEAEPVVHGRWIKGVYPGEYTCSRCGMEYCEADPDEMPFKYCPECGSKNE